MLSTLTEKTSPKHCALLLVDVQNEFCAEGGAPHREGRDLSLIQAMVPRLESLLNAARAAKVPCIWIRCAYNTKQNWYLSETWLEQSNRKRKGSYVTYPVCEPGEWNADFYHIRPNPDEVIVTKHRFGSFEGTDLDLVLRSRGIRTLIMTGVATNVCVETTAREGFLKDYYIVFTSDCTATFSQAMHDATLFNIDQFFGEVVTARDIMTCWEAAGPLRAAS
jgi:ureidoacrylate peracid hydrolase